MSGYEKSAIQSELNEYPNAFYGKRFNIAFDGKLVLLKTSSPDGKLVPYNFGADLAQTYETQRDKVSIFYNKEQAMDRIYQINLIDGILKGFEIDDINLFVFYFLF